MKRWVARAWLVALGAALIALPGSAQSLSTLAVKISGLRNTEGVALVTLYDSEVNWLRRPKDGKWSSASPQPVQVVSAPIRGSELTVEFKDVKPGTYAVQVVHDENKNNKLDMRWLPWPKPKEGVGISNEPDNKAGPPKWDAAKFDVGGPVTIKIKVKYVD